MRFLLYLMAAAFGLVLVSQLFSGTGREHKNMPYSKTTYTYKTVQNCRLKADVYRYPDEQLRPAILWLHGGALIFGSRSWLKKDQLEFYLKAGFTVISIDYRLAPETKLDEIIRDLQDAYAWIRKEGREKFKIDPERIAVIGHSAGGYLTLMAGICLSPKPKALVSFYGYGDITGSWYSEPDPFYNEGWKRQEEDALSVISDSVISETPDEDQWKGRLDLFYIYCRQQGVWPQYVSGHDPSDDPSWFRRYEPLQNVTENFPPTLLLHGEKDTDVPFEQSAMMAKALEKSGVPYEFLTCPDWGHVFDDAGLSQPLVEKAFAQIQVFLSKHVKQTVD